MQSENKEKFSNLSTGQIVGISISSFLLLLVIILIIIIIVKRKYSIIFIKALFHFHPFISAILTITLIMIITGIIIGFIFSVPKSNENFLDTVDAKS